MFSAKNCGIVRDEVENVRYSLSCQTDFILQQNLIKITEQMHSH